MSISHFITILAFHDAGWFLCGRWSNKYVVSVQTGFRDNDVFLSLATTWIMLPNNKVEPLVMTDLIFKVKPPRVFLGHVALNPLI